MSLANQILLGVLSAQVLQVGLGPQNGQKSICGSAAGSTGIALDMLRFCAVHNIKPLVEAFPFSRCNEAIEKVNNNKIRFRAVLQHQHN